VSLADPYREVAAKILDAARDNGAYAKLEHLTDRIGHRLAGEPSLDRAIEWAVATLRADGHEDVRKDKVMVPHWVRGEERLEIVLPVPRELVLLALGGSVGTPKKGLSAELAVVSSFDELEALGPDKVKGKIVLFNHAMPPYDEQGSHYGETVKYRWQGAVRAAKLGAVATLVRSVTARSLRTPHTGSMGYEEGVARIPAAAVATEDADLLARLSRSGEPVKVRLVLGAQMLPDVESANVIGELKGHSKPEEIVVLGAHLDSWDVGQGANDDGAGCVIVMEALTLLRKLGLSPKRTLRVVLYTNEENGLRGAKAYAAQHAAERHIAAIEADSGAHRPAGFQLTGTPADLSRARELATLLAPWGAEQVTEGDAGADISALEKTGIPLFGLYTHGDTYFDIHHSAADTLDKINPEHLSQDVAVMALWAYLLADAW
jgi:Zn-dependent M28 family amino/carboxypeptidase